MEDRILTVEAVKSLMSSTLLSDESDAPDAQRIEIHGILHNYAFHAERVIAKEPEILKLLCELPAPFMVGSGGGWSFIQMCEDKHEFQWTGDHLMMEALVCLGLAVKRLIYCAPKEIWPSFPAGMPYVCVLNEQAAPPTTPAWSTGREEYMLNQEEKPRDV